MEDASYDNNARSISQGTRDTLASYAGLHVLGSQPSELWSPETAQSMIRDALKIFGPERLNAAIAANDDMSFGIADVLASLGLTKRIILIGGDGDAKTIAMIRSVALAGTVLQDS